MNRSRYVAVGLAGVVALLLAASRRKEATEPADPNVASARKLIRSLETDRRVSPYAARGQLQAAAEKMRFVSPAAYQELLDAVGRLSGRIPTPQPTTDAHVLAARALIEQTERLPVPAEVKAQQLENAAIQYQAVSPAAAQELREAAVRARGRAIPPPPAPTTDVHVLAARALIEQVDKNPLIPPAEAVRTLDAAAEQVRATSPQAAQELNDAATRINRRVYPNA